MPIDDLLIASANRGKISEFRDMLGAGEHHWRDLAQTPLPGVEETGATFRANAMIKAAHYARLAGCWALADDSGLAVDALGGAPGVYSARWAERHSAGSGDGDNNALLLQQLEDVADDKRTAAFVCVLALADPQGRIALTAADHVSGVVLRCPRGQNGFGYDPLFLLPERGLTTAELAPAEKHRISHRGRALRRLRSLMHELGL